MKKVFYKGSFHNVVVDCLTVDDVECTYGGFGETDCYLPECTEYCLINVDGVNTIVPSAGCFSDVEESEVVPEYVDLGDTEIDLADIETLVDVLHSLGMLVGPVEMFLIDQPMECDMIVDCKVSGEKHSVFLKISDKMNFTKASLQNRISDSTNLYSKKARKEQLVDSLKNKARLFKYNLLGKCYINDDAAYVTATTNEGESMLTVFPADDADSAAQYLEANEGQKIVKSDENGIYIGNESIDETSVRDIKEVSDTKYRLLESRKVLDSFGKIFNGRWSYVGDVRRGVPDFSRVQVVVDSDKSSVMKRLKSIKGVKKIKDCNEFVCCECDGIPFDVYSAEGCNYVPTVILMTGTDEFNVMLLANALENGCYFTEDGVYDDEGECYDFIDEQDCFNTCGVEYVEPTKRNLF